MRCLVTGAAGFIGSHLAERLVADGHDVVGLDCFMPYYPRPIKERNLAGLRSSGHFAFHELDLRSAELAPALDGVEVIFHEAAMAGLAASWVDFDLYMTCNIQATQRLLDACRGHDLRSFVHISTSSVYGEDALGDEQTLPAPISPYGATKLAAERLAVAYHKVFGVPSVILRYFSVYGPRQRPDMGYNIFIDRVLRGEPIALFGDGEQTRGNTFITDCVNATLLGAERGQPGEVYNIGGGEARSVNWVIETIADLAGKPARVRREAARAGDQRHTMADISKARSALGYEPTMPLRDGLAAQVAWQRGLQSDQ
ncbi:MAG: NAD-dependent epimerase/dehydratase family protein [Chloroflexota bacterium]